MNATEAQADILSPVMEEQADHQSLKDNKDHPDNPTSSNTRSSPEDSASKSVQTLRFPRPQGSQVLANWVSSSAPDIMASPPYDDESPLSESDFEFVSVSRANTEDSSQDGDMSESLPELERYPNPNEVQAFRGLDDMSNSAASTIATDSDTGSEEDEGEEEVGEQEDRTAIQKDMISHSRESSFDHFELTSPEDPDEMLRTPPNLDSATRLFLPTAIPSPPAHSIEFSEPEDIDVHIDKISVKHTVKEFSEAEAAEFFRRADLGVAPSRVSATIRQTMSQRCLSTQEAFRVLYVGDEAMKGEIILKISRAITCSSSLDHNEDKTLRRNTEGVYNIVPVTFGAVKDRDVELMEASAFQIKVDTCTDAEKIPINSKYFDRDIIFSLTIDGGNRSKKYKSVPAAGPEGARVQPAWTLPHVAVFYCSEEDDYTRWGVKEMAWEFCRRHAIPTLFISDYPAFASPVGPPKSVARHSPAVRHWTNYTNEHAICLCLESRSWDHEMRFPIDLDSFLNIDNRQMNQNLAYLTGLEEPVPVVDDKLKVHRSCAAQLNESWKRLTEGELKHAPVNVLDVVATLHRCMRAMLSLPQYRELLLCLTMTMLVGIYLMGLAQNDLVPAPASDASILDGSSNTPSISTVATATVTINHTSTKTVRVPSETPVVDRDFLHIIREAKKARDKMCSVELIGEHDILVKVPDGIKGPVHVEVHRDKARVPCELSTPSSDVIVIDVPREETYGVVTVRVVTGGKTFIDETFLVDFRAGFSDKAQEFLYEIAHTINEARETVQAVTIDYVNYVSSFSVPDEQFKATAASWWDSVKVTTQAAQVYSSQKTGQVLDWVKDSVRREDAAAVLKDAQQKFADQWRKAEDFRKEGELAVLRAQIASRLWWLKVQGKTQEYEMYQRQARDFMTKKHRQVTEAKEARRMKEMQDTIIGRIMMM